MPRPPQLTHTMRKALADIRDGNPFASCRGRSEHGGRWQVLYALRKRGLATYHANRWHLTPEGTAALAP